MGVDDCVNKNEIFFYRRAIENSLFCSCELYKMEFTVFSLSVKRSNDELARICIALCDGWSFNGIRAHLPTTLNILHSHTYSMDFIFHLTSKGSGTPASRYYCSRLTHWQTRYTSQHHFWMEFAWKAFFWHRCRRFFHLKNDEWKRDVTMN